MVALVMAFMSSLERQIGESWEKEEEGQDFCKTEEEEGFPSRQRVCDSITSWVHSQREKL